MRSRVRAPRRAWSATALVLVTAIAGAACSERSQRVTVRSPDGVQVMHPSEVRAVKAARRTGTQTTVPGSTIPQNEDKRPIEERLFEAFGDFRRCIEDSGQTIRGDLTDQSNPAFRDPEYVKVLQKCAARTKIAEVYQEFQNVRSKLTPEQVRERNEAFKKLQPCLEKRGWTIETRTSEIGLIEPTTFAGPDGTINERDVQQCAADVGIDPAELDN